MIMASIYKMTPLLSRFVNACLVIFCASVGMLIWDLSIAMAGIYKKIMKAFALALFGTAAYAGWWVI